MTEIESPSAGISIVTVLGAGGVSGSHFIDGALTELWRATGFRLEHSSAIIGTSAGAFRAASAGPAVAMPIDVAHRLQRLARPAPRGSRTNRVVRRLRVGAGRLIARTTPRHRPEPSWSVSGPAHHRGVSIVTVDLGRRARVDHRLATVDSASRVVNASAAIPFVYGPVRLDGVPHGDGAIWSPCSVDLAGGRRPDLVVVIAPMVPHRTRTLPQWFHRHQLDAEIGDLGSAPHVLVIRPPEGTRRRSRSREWGIGAVRTLAGSVAFTPTDD